MDDFDGSSFNPPIDATRTQIPQLSQYTQVVTVLPVFANKLNANTNPAAPDLPKSTYTGAVRVQVRIMYQADPDRRRRSRCTARAGYGSHSARENPCGRQTNAIAEPEQPYNRPEPT